MHECYVMKHSSKNVFHITIVSAKHFPKQMLINCAIINLNEGPLGEYLNEITFKIKEHFDLLSQIIASGDRRGNKFEIIIGDRIVGERIVRRWIIRELKSKEWLDGGWIVGEWFGREGSDKQWLDKN